VKLSNIVMTQLIRAIFCSSLIFSFLLTNCAKKTTTPASGSLGKNEVSNLSTDDMSVAILYFVNTYRKSIGRVPVQPNHYESEVALQHSVRMARKITPFGHAGFESRIKAIEKQLGPMQATAENVAYGQMTAREVVDSWLQSPAHRKNIEGNYVLTGIGCAKSNTGVIYYTEIFTR